MVAPLQKENVSGSPQRRFMRQASRYPEALASLQ